MKKLVFVFLWAFLSVALAVSSSPQPSNQDDNLNLSSQALHLTGPLRFGVQYSHNYGAFLSLGYVQRLNALNAIALSAEGGRRQRRVDATWAHIFNQRQRIKLTAEYLSQKLRFDFLSGNVSRWVGQGAYGLSYQYLLKHSFFRYLDMDAYYADARSKNLSPKDYQDATGWYENLRHIAGAKASGGDIGVTVKPVRSNSLQVLFNYDRVDYDTKYEHGKDRSGFGSTINFDQLLTPRSKILLSGSDRKTYESLGAGFDWLVLTEPEYYMTLEVQGTRVFGVGALPNDTLLDMNLIYRWNTQQEDKAKYSLDTLDSVTNITDWAAKPAVYMPQVLAVKDEAKVALKNKTKPQNLTAHKEKPAPTDKHPEDKTYVLGEKIPSFQYKALDLFEDPQALFNTLKLTVTGLEGSKIVATFTPDPEKADNGTLVFSGTAPDKSHVYHVRIYATNLYGESEETQDFTITVTGDEKPTVTLHQKSPYPVLQTVSNEDIADIEANTGTLKHTIKVANKSTWKGYGLTATVEYAQDDKTAKVELNGKTSDPTWSQQSLAITGVENSKGLKPDGTYNFLLNVVSPPIWQRDINNQYVDVEQGHAINTVNLNPSDDPYFKNPSPNITGDMSFKIKDSPETGLSVDGDKLEGTATASPGDYVVKVYAHNTQGDSVDSDYTTSRATLYHLRIEPEVVTAYLMCPAASTYTLSNGVLSSSDEDTLGNHYDFASENNEVKYKPTKLYWARYSSTEKRLECAYTVSDGATISTYSGTTENPVPAPENAKNVIFTNHDYPNTKDMCTGDREYCQLQFDV